MEETYIYYHVYDGSVSSEKLTRRGLERYLEDSGKGVDRKDPDIRRRTSHGKPYFAGYPDIFHNVSHSGGWWVCAYGESENGLDLQQNADNPTEKLARRFLHPLEQEWLRDKDPSQFYRLWAYNESYLKYTGEGLARELNSFSAITLRDRTTSIGVPGLCQKEIPFPREGYWLVLTTREPHKVIIKSLI
ncbi:MAG: 4'-phosphopantetheinyl transferase superfamily protein [Eubacterium sp.]|nr:4'-phosphopantetheinyl transferase superfamily protein [Eubacterium sp.]